MKRNIFWKAVGVLPMFAMAAGFSSCDDEEFMSSKEEAMVLISGISIGVTQELPLLIGTDSLLTWEVLPENATNKNVIWTSASPEVASVSADGTVSAKALGTAVITASPEWGYATTSSIRVEVVDHIDYITGINLTNPEEDLSIYATASVQLKWTIVPENATYPGLKWESLTPEIATVSETGLVRGVAPGTAQIRATATDSQHFSEVFEITVMPVIPIESLEIDASQKELAKGEMSKLNVKVTPEYATVSTLVWESSNPSVVSFDEDGVMTVHDYGSVTITASAEYEGSSVSATLDARVVEGKVNDTFDYTNHWAIFKEQGTISGLNEGKLIITPGDDKNYKAFRIERKGGINFHVGNYPILAFKIELPADVITSSTKKETYLDIWTKDLTPNGGKYCGDIDGGKNKMQELNGTDYIVFYADLAANSIGTGTNKFTLSPTQTYEMDNVEFQLWKLWYGSDAPVEGTVKVDWVKTFKSEDELKAFVGL